MHTELTTIVRKRVEANRAVPVIGSLERSLYSSSVIKINKYKGDDYQ
jgi:hypothetical protein